MATITLNIPDAVIPRVVDALCAAGHWSEDLGVTRNAFAKQEVARMVRERVVAIETEQARVAAEVHPPEPDVT